MAHLKIVRSTSFDYKAAGGFFPMHYAQQLYFNHILQNITNRSKSPLVSCYNHIRISSKSLDKQQMDQFPYLYLIYYFPSGISLIKNVTIERNYPKSVISNLEVKTYLAFISSK